MTPGDLPKASQSLNLGARSSIAARFSIDGIEGCVPNGIVPFDQRAEVAAERPKRPLPRNRPRVNRSMSCVPRC
jgi:hypothetical protein